MSKQQKKHFELMGKDLSGYSIQEMFAVIPLAGLYLEKGKPLGLFHDKTDANVFIKNQDKNNSFKINSVVALSNGEVGYVLTGVYFEPIEVIAKNES